MCLIIAQQKDTARIPTERIANAFLANGDGAGMAFVNAKGQVYVDKPYFSPGPFVEMYQWAHDTFGKESPIILHMRIATHGGVTEGNTHPHWIAQRHAALAHNGIIPIDVPKASPDSDTVLFINRFMANMRPEKLHHAKRRERLGRAIGHGNKFAIVVNTRDLYIINEAQGHWDKGVWYSNYSYRKQYYRGTGPVTDAEWGEWSQWLRQANAPAPIKPLAPRLLPNGLPIIPDTEDDDGDTYDTYTRPGSFLRIPKRPKGHHKYCACRPCDDYFEAVQRFRGTRQLPDTTEDPSVPVEGDDAPLDMMAGDVEDDERMDLGTAKPDPAAGSGFLGAGD